MAGIRLIFWKIPNYLMYSMCACIKDAVKPEKIRRMRTGISAVDLYAENSRRSCGGKNENSYFFMQGLLLCEQRRSIHVFVEIIIDVFCHLKPEHSVSCTRMLCVCVCECVFVRLNQTYVNIIYDVRCENANATGSRMCLRSRPKNK